MAKTDTPTTDNAPAPAPKRTPEEIARELFPDCDDFRTNSGGDVTCKNGKGQTVLVPASKIAQYS